MKKERYTEENSEYFEKNSTWHVEDSPWKAKQILKIINRNFLRPKSIVEVGCGAGEILLQLRDLINDATVKYAGYDISPDAYGLSKSRSRENLVFFNEDFLTKEDAYFDLCLVIDVFEHVDNYIGFIEKCGTKATYKIYHIPLDLHVSALLRNKLVDARNSVGHIHYFSKDTALATIQAAGQQVIDYFYTPGALELPGKGIKTKIANLFRKVLFKIHSDFAVRLVGGYSLIVLTK